MYSAQLKRNACFEGSSDLFWVWNHNGVGTWLIFKIGLCSAISFKRSRRELAIDVTAHWSKLKNYQNTHYPRCSFIPKTGVAFPKTGVLFWLCGLSDKLVLLLQKMDQMVSSTGEVANLYRLVDGHATSSMAVQAAVIAGLSKAIVDRTLEVSLTNLLKFLPLEIFCEWQFSLFIYLFQLMTENAAPVVIGSPIQEER